VIGRTRLTGKESNKIEEIDAGLVIETTVTTYAESSSVDVQSVARSVLSGRSAESLARLSGSGAFNRLTGRGPVSSRTVERFRSDDGLSPRALRTMLTLAAYLAAETLAVDNADRLHCEADPPRRRLRHTAAASGRSLLVASAGVGAASLSRAGHDTRAPRAGPDTGGLPPTRDAQTISFVWPCATLDGMRITDQRQRRGGGLPWVGRPTPLATSGSGGEVACRG